MENKIIKKNWTTPELSNFGDVVSLTNDSVKKGGEGDEYLEDMLTPWTSCCC